MRNEMMKGYVDAIVLSVLQRKDAYGYEISKVIQEETEGLFEMKEGTLYPALKRMEANKYIEGYWDDRQSGPRRRYYQITKQGLKKLEENKKSWDNNFRVINLFLRSETDGQSQAVHRPNLTT